MFGFLNVRKLPGPTSHDVVAAVRRLLPRGVKVGHAGTLDPFAEGVLVVCVGPATRLAEYVQAQPKRYLATVTFGATSTTDDLMGEISPVDVARPPTDAQLRDAVRPFVGRIEQAPPAHSAVHVGGQRAYKLARRGEVVSIPPRPVDVHAIDVVSYDWPELVIDVRCGSGTYVRGLARDIGRTLGVGGYCSALTRTAVGAFAVEEAVPLEDLLPVERLIDPVEVLAMPVVKLGEQAARLIAQGRSLDVARLDMPEEGRRAEGRGGGVSSTPPPPGEVASLRAGGGVFAAVDATGRLLAVATIAEDGRALTPLKVFPA